MVQGAKDGANGSGSERWSERFRDAKGAGSGRERFGARALSGRERFQGIRVSRAAPRLYRARLLLQVEQHVQRAGQVSQLCSKCAHSHFFISRSVSMRARVLAAVAPPHLCARLRLREQLVDGGAHVLLHLDQLAVVHFRRNKKNAQKSAGNEKEGREGERRRERGERKWREEEGAGMRAGMRATIEELTSQRESRSAAAILIPRPSFCPIFPGFFFVFLFPFAAHR